MAINVTLYRAHASSLKSIFFLLFFFKSYILMMTLNLAALLWLFYFLVSVEEDACALQFIKVLIII